jgi:hypothetical protein
VPLSTASPLPSPVPELESLPTQAVATIPPAATPMPWWPLPAESDCAAAPMEMELGWGCAFVEQCDTNEDALRGLCDILGYDRDCCGGQGLDPHGDLDKSFSVQRRQPEAPMECSQGTVHDYVEQRRGGRSRVRFKMETGGTDFLSVTAHRNREPQRSPPHLDRLAEGSQVTVCGTQAIPFAVHARFIVQWMPGDSCRLWLAPPGTQDRRWLVGTGREMQ